MKMLTTGLALAAVMTSSLMYTSNAVASAANWVGCANEGQNCTFTNVANKVVTMRYGVPGSYHYIWARNLDGNSLQCSHTFMGDPKPGVVKSCDFSAYNFYDIPTSNNDWSDLCGEGQQCATTGGTSERWLRYGANGSYIYTPIAPNQLITCAYTDIAKGIDPIYGVQKRCQIIKTGYDDTLALGEDTDFTTCANEGQICNLPSMRPTVVRYGAYDSSQGRYRYTTNVVTQGSFVCGVTAFGFDSFYGTSKHCSYMPLDYKTDKDALAAGRWVSVADNGGSGNRTLSREIWTGVVTTDTDSTSNEWKHDLTVGISYGVEVLGVTKAVSVSVSNSFAHSSSTSTAISREQREKVTTSCSTSGTGFYKMWRFETDLSFVNCMSEGVCNFTAQPVSTFCSTTNQMPQCVPGYCADANCQVCTY